MSRKTRKRRSRSRQEARPSGIPKDPVRGPRGPQAGYDAVQDKKKRTAPRVSTMAEDKQLDTTNRRKLNATTRDQLRNFSAVAWMVRKHIDYVSRFGFQVKTEDDGLNRDLEALIADKCHARNFDASGRFNRQRFVSICECLRVLDGDVFALKLRSGLVQGIEGDRIAKPWDMPSELQKIELTHGVEVSKAGRPLRYCICTRKDSRRAFDKMVYAHQMIPHGFWWRFDAVRGVSPLSSAVNAAQDIYEALDYNVIKAKIHALFGVAITRKEAMGAGGLPMEEPEQTPAETQAGEATDLASQWAKFKPGVGALFELGDGEDVKPIESNHPPSQFLEFTQLEIRLILLALDIPFTFYDSRSSSYSARLGDNQQYMLSSATKQEDVRSWLNKWTAWRLNLAVNRDRELALPRGMEVSDVPWHWQPTTPYPWTDTLKETKADIESIKAGLSSPQRVCKRRGGDFFEIVDELAEAQAYAADKGVTLEFAWTPDPTAATSGDKSDD